MTNDFLTIFQAGYAAGTIDQNPHYLTSDCSDAFVLGVTWRRSQRGDQVRELHKSRGYTWLVDGVKYRVDGAEVARA